MNTEFIGERIGQLRSNLGVSAREMSLSLGQADNYINHIENGKSLPSVTALFYIFEYLKVTPQEFFDSDTKHPEKLNMLIADLKRLDDTALSYIIGIVREMLK